MVFGKTPWGLTKQTFGRDALYQPHPYLPYSLKSGVHGNLSINKEGIRGPNRPLQKTLPRILLLGGSHTFQEELLQNETWPFLLEKELQGLEVINAAGNGITTADSLIAYSLKHSKYQPDLLIVYHGPNDLDPSFHFPFKSDYSHQRRSIQNEWITFFEKFPKVFDILPSFVTLRYLLSGNSKDIWTRFTLPPYELRLNRRADLSAFQANLENIIYMAKGRGSQVLLLGFIYDQDQMARDEESDVALAWKNELIYQKQIFQKLASRFKHVNFFDISKKIEANKKTLRDCCHLTREGSQIFTKELSQYLKNQKSKGVYPWLP